MSLPSIGGKSVSTATDARSDNTDNKGTVVRGGRNTIGLQNNNAEFIGSDSRSTIAKDNEGLILNNSNRNEIYFQRTDHGAVEEALDLAEFGLETNKKIVFETLEKNEDVFEASLENSRILNKELSKSLTTFGQDIARANRSNGQELVDALKEMFKWGLVAYGVAKSIQVLGKR